MNTDPSSPQPPSSHQSRSSPAPASSPSTQTAAPLRGLLASVQAMAMPLLFFAVSVTAVVAAAAQLFGELFVKGFAIEIPALWLMGLLVVSTLGWSVVTTAGWLIRQARRGWSKWRHRLQQYRVGQLQRHASMVAALCFPGGQAFDRLPGHLADTAPAPRRLLALL